MKKYIAISYGSISDFVIKVKKQGKHEDELVDFKYISMNEVVETVNKFAKLYKTKTIIDFTQEFYR